MQLDFPWSRVSLVILLILIFIVFVMAKQYIESKDFDIVGHYNDHAVTIYKDERGGFYGKWSSSRPEFFIRELLKDVLYIFYFADGETIFGTLTTKGGGARIWFENGTYWKRDKTWFQQLLFNLNIFNWFSI